jgi:membrane protein DedA with SNARE-associated domain
VLTTAAAALASNPPPELPGFLNAVGGQLNHYGYWAVLVLVMLEDFGIPVPGETILIAAAIFAGAGKLNVVLVGVVGFIAAVLGDNIGFAIGHFGGRALALRWGKYIFLTEERLNKAEYFFDHNGARIIIVARFIEGLRQANGIIAGITGMHWRRFLVFNAIGAALWVGTWVTLGYVAGNHIGTIYHDITQYSLYALIALVLVVVALVIRHVLRRRRRAAARAAGEPRENVEPSSRASVHEDSEAIEQHGVQEAEEIQDSAGIKGGADPGGAEAPAGPGNVGSTEVTDSADRANSTEVTDSADRANSTEVTDSADRANSTEVTDSADRANSTEVTDSADGENGAGVQGSAKTQSS